VPRDLSATNWGKQDHHDGNDDDEGLDDDTVEEPTRY
jgi:hypothetical protein